jgi:WD40 repeat protein
MSRLAMGIVLVALSAAACAEPPITALAFSPDAGAVVAGSQGGIDIRSWPSLEVVRRLDTALPHVHDLSFSPRGDRLIVVGGAPSDVGGFELFSWPEGELVHSATDHEDTAYAASWAADASSFALAAGDERVSLWSAASGERTQDFIGHSRRVLAVAHIPQSEVIVSAGVDQSLRVWSLASGNLIRVLDNHTGEVRDLAVRPGNGDLPLVASAAADRTVRLWQPTIGRMVRFVRLPAEPLSLAWAGDGARLAITCTDGHLRVIDPESLEIILDEPVIEGWAYEVAVAPNGTTAIVAGSDGQVRSKSMPPP